MRREFLIITLFVGVFLDSDNNLYAYGNKQTHPALTDKAVTASVVDDYLKTQIGLTEGLATELKWDFPSDIKKRITSGKKTWTVSEWLKAGSEIEDQDERWWPIRARHHFHDPINDAGLDNHTDHPDWDGAPTWVGWIPLGESALKWATVVPIGCPASKTAFRVPSGRKKLKEICFFEEYGRKQ